MISHVQTGQMNSEEVPADAQKNDTGLELKNSFKAPVEGEARFKQIVDMLFDGTLIIQDGVIIETNQGLLSMTGYEPTELLGRKFEDLDGWGDLGSALAAVSEKSTSFESLLPRKYSSPVYATVRASRLSSGEPPIVIAVIAGMTENEPASAALLRSAERYRSLFQTIPDFIFTADKDLRFVEVNPAMEKALDLPASQIVGRTAADVYGKEAGERIRAWDLRALSGETIEEEHAVLVKGEKLIFHDIRVPLRNSAGQIMGVCGICRDITERRAIEGKSTVVPTGHRSKATERTMQLARQAATTDSIVLLLGESGSGKDHLARWIHDHSSRSSSPFLAINCAAVPQDLAESELFGHESGAFTGAGKRKRGLLELAEGGTLLLNEIGELSLPVQSKLLVFLDTRSFVRLGGEKGVQVDARILAATSRDLETEVVAGRFMESLFYRLNVLSIRVPPLRERLEDIPTLARELLSKLLPEMNISKKPELDAPALDALMNYRWPGNIRELRNVLERGLILARTGPFRVAVPSSSRIVDSCSIGVSFLPGQSLDGVLKGVTKSICMAALKRSGGNKAAAARSLRVSRDSFYRYLKDKAE